MFDLALNSDFSVHLDDTNDLATVEGREAFEQSIVWHLTELMHERLPGFTGSKDTTIQKIELIVNRVARRHEMIDGIADLSIGQTPDAPDTYEVEIIYTSEEVFSETFSP